MSAAGQELARHLPCYNTQYDGKGGVAHEAHGGIWCRCGEWDSGPVKGIRPWEDYWEHVGQSVARVAVEAALAPIEREMEEQVDEWGTPWPWVPVIYKALAAARDTAKGE